MNSILNKRNQNQITQPSFRDFAMGMTPEKAKAQVEQMLASGQISQQQFEQAKQIANSILKNK